MYFLTPTGFINGQEKPRCYVNSSFKVQFLNICTQKLILNIDCEKKIQQLDGNGYEFTLNSKRL